VEHRLALADQACLEEALTATRQAHQRIHDATATLAELLEGQSLAGVQTAQQQLQAAAAAAHQALDALP
jgi:uncharacterized protein YukE